MSDERWKMATGYSTPDEANAALLDQSAKIRTLEADNAALWRDVREAHEVMAETWPTRAIVKVLAATLSVSHPGAELLAQMEKDSEAIKAHRRQLMRLANIPDAQWRELEVACREYHLKRTTGAGGSAICACGAGSGGSRACCALKALVILRDDVLSDVMSAELSPPR